MVLGDWVRATTAFSSDLPVLFYLNEDEFGDIGAITERYLDGQAVYASRYWESGVGWKPCLVVNLSPPS